MTRGRILEEPRRLIDALRTALPALLGASITGSCTTHAAIANRLYVGDVVISLNYDCVVGFLGRCQRATRSADLGGQPA